MYEGISLAWLIVAPPLFYTISVVGGQQMERTISSSQCNNASTTSIYYGRLSRCLLRIR
jgi:hypothetical protein